MAARTPARATWTAFALLVPMGAAWGLEFSMLKLAARAGYPEAGALAAMLAIVAAAYWVAIAWRGAWFRPTRRIVVFLLAVATLGYVLPLLAALFAARHVDAGVMTLVASFTPIVAVATALAFRTERVSPRRVLAVVLGMASATIVLLPDAGPPQAGALAWLLVVFVVPLTYGVESVYVSVAWPDGLTPLQIGAGQALVALLAVVPIHLALEPPMAYDPDWNAGQIAIAVMAACLLVEVFLYFFIIRATGGVLVSFGLYVSLFAGIAWGAVLFGERLDAATWLAVGVLAAGLALAAPRAGASE